MGRWVPDGTFKLNDGPTDSFKSFCRWFGTHLRPWQREVVESMLDENGEPRNFTIAVPRQSGRTVARSRSSAPRTHRHR